MDEKMKEDRDVKRKKKEEKDAGAPPCRKRFVCFQMAR